MNTPHLPPPFAPPLSRTFVSDKTFFTVLISLFALLFALIPPMVITTLPEAIGLDIIIPDMSEWRLMQMYEMYLQSETTKHNVEIDELPLFFAHQELPAGSISEIDLHDLKYLQLAERLELLQKEGKEIYIGYINIYDTKEAKGMPTVRHT